MSNHLTVDEMMEFICADKVDTAFFTLAAKVNAHLVSCDSCRKVYDALMAVDEAMDAVKAYTPKPKKTALQVLKGIILARGEGTLSPSFINNCVDSLAKAKTALMFNVENMCRLVSEQLGNGAVFYHPVLAATTKSYGGEGNDAIDSVLTDGENNQVSIGLDGTLTVVLNEDDYAEGTLVMLLPADSEEEPYSAVAEEYGKDTVSVRFENVSPGKYSIVLIE